MFQLYEPPVYLTPNGAGQALEMDELQQDAAAAARVADEAAELRAAEVDLGFHRSRFISWANHSAARAVIIPLRM